MTLNSSKPKTADQLKLQLLGLFSKVCAFPSMRGRATIGNWLYKILRPSHTNVTLDLGHGKVSMDLKYKQSRFIFFSTFEKGEIAFLKKILKKGDTVIDVGANVGFLSAVCAEAIGEKGKVFAIEADPENYQHLLKTADYYSNIIQPFHLAISNKSGEVCFFRDTESPMYSSLKFSAISNEGKEIKVSAVTIDDFIEKNQIQGKIKLIKIDVEGAEDLVVEGMLKTIKGGEAAVMCEITPWIHHKEGKDEKTILNIFSQNKYKSFAIEKNGNLRMIKDGSDVQTVNYVFIHEELVPSLNHLIQ